MAVEAIGTLSMSERSPSSVADLEAALRWAFRFPVSTVPRPFRKAFAALAATKNARALAGLDHGEAPKRDDATLARRIAHWEAFLADLADAESEQTRAQVEATLARLRNELSPSSAQAPQEGRSGEDAGPTFRRALEPLYHDLPPCVVWRELSGDAALAGLEEGLSKAEREALDIDVSAGDLDRVQVYNGRARFLLRQVFWAFVAAAEGMPICAPRLLLRDGGFEPLDLCGDVDVVYGTGLIEDLRITAETAPEYLSMALDLAFKGRVRCPATAWPIAPAPPPISEPAEGQLDLTCRLNGDGFVAHATFTIDKTSGQIALARVAAAGDAA